jgi:hypothetical protein
MTIIGAIMDKVMRRTGFKAYVDDRLIRGCGECKYNLDEPNPIPFMKDVPNHRCEMNIGLDGKHMTILDPHNIPEMCPFKIVDIIEPAVAR